MKRFALFLLIGLCSLAYSQTTYNCSQTGTVGSGSFALSCTPAVVIPPVTLPVISSFTASPAAILAGQSTVLSFDVTGESTLTLSGVSGTPVTGMNESPAATTTYVLTATNSAGSVTQSVTVTVSPATTKPAIAGTNVDDSLTGWMPTCVNPNCSPGGSGAPSAVSETIDNTATSIDGKSMLLSETTSEKYTNALWSWKGGACDSCTSVNTDFWFYPVSATDDEALEFDAFIFDLTHNVKIMWGMQWNQAGKVWQIYAQSGANKGWINTTLKTPPVFGAWNHLQVSDSRTIGDTSCSGTECMVYNSITLNGVTTNWNLKEPAGPNPSNWHNSGFQFQLDSNNLSTSKVTLQEYIDEANFAAYE